MDRHNLLHPPLLVKKLEKKDEGLFIRGMKNGKFDVIFLDAHFGTLPKSVDVPVKEFSKFLDAPVCQNLKAVFFLPADCDNSNIHTVNPEIRQMVYDEVRKRKWYIYIIHHKAYLIMKMLFASKIDSKPGDVIFNVLSNGQMVTVSELQRNQEGYSFIDDRNVNCFNRNINDVATEILGTCNPKYVTICDPENNDLVMSLRSRVNLSKNVINIDPKGMAECTPQVMTTIFDRGYTQLIPFSMDDLVVTNELNITAPEQTAIIVDGYNDLPLEKVKIVPKSKKPYYVFYLDTVSESYKLAGEAQLSKEPKGHHRIKLALVVDRNSLPFLYQEPFIIPEIQSLPQKLASSKANFNVPVIGFFDNSSVICVRDENGYRFLKEWNGLYGNDLYLSFEQEEPIMIIDLNKVKTKDRFVVYDLIKILSMPPNDLKIDPKWVFKVTSDAENPVLLRFKTFLGSRKATPVSLIVYFLKYHIKAIDKETGKKPKELGFCLFNQFTKKEKKRIKTGLEEACKRLEIDFVFVTNV